MFTFQVRPRVFRLRGNGTPVFPCEAEASIFFRPHQPFGMAADGGLTAVQGFPVTGRFDAHSGQYSVKSEHPLSPLRAQVDSPLALSWEGNRVRAAWKCDTQRSLQKTIEVLYFGIPILLATELIDPPYVERVEGIVDNIPFTWELTNWQLPCDVTTQQLQTERVTRASEHLEVLTAPSNTRVVAALHYFHIACRLRREARTPGEFLGESLLNLNRILEVLYGPNRDTVRGALAELGIDREKIERDFIPVMLLRNAMDVGHPSLSRLTPEQLRTLHRFADHAEYEFRYFLQRLLALAKSRNDVIPHYEDHGPDANLVRTIEELRARLGDELL